MPIIAIRSPHHNIQLAATFALGHPSNSDVVQPLIEIALDKNELESVRGSAVHALARTYDHRALAPILQIASDLTENVDLRVHALEHSTCLPVGEDDVNMDATFQIYSQLLADPVPDLRYWAAFGIEKLGWVMDISPTVSALDRMVAHDYAIPNRFGWHVNREAILALEEIYYHPYKPIQDGRQYKPGSMYTLYTKVLISPAPEYYSFMHDYRPWNGKGAYDTLPTPPVTLSIDSLWLADRLQKQWPHILLNKRQPRPQGYLLDWLLTLDGHYLIGALHHDKYAVVITGRVQETDIFAEWYKKTVGLEYKLLMYDWPVMVESSVSI